MRIVAVLVLVLAAFVSEVSAQSVQGGGPRGTGENAAPAFVPNNSGDGATNLAEEPSESALAAPSGYAGPVNRAIGVNDLRKNGGRDMWGCKEWDGCPNHAGQNSYSGGTAPNGSNFGTRSRPISEPQAP